MVVVISIFLFIIGTAIMMFISILQNQRRMLAEQELFNQLSYAIEHMSKAMRMAKRDYEGSCLVDTINGSFPNHNFLLTRQDTNANSYRGIKFISSSDNDSCYEFFLDTDGVLKELKNSTVDSDAIPLTSERLKINYIRFSLSGSDGTITSEPYDPQGVQPRVTISMDIEINSGGENLSQRVQATVSQRNLNIEE